MVQRKVVLRGLTEFVLIVSGVLAALGVEELRESRSDVALERSYVLRLVRDLRADTAGFVPPSFFEWKDRGLQRLLVGSGAQQRVSPPADSIASWVVELTQTSWGFPPVESTTFRELENTGALRLIRSAPLRSAIAQYYTYHEFQRDLVNARSTDFARLSYQLVVRSPGRDFDVDVDSDIDAGRLMSSLVSEEFQGAVTAEINRNRRFASSTQNLLDRAEELIADLCDYLEGCPPDST